METRSNLEAVTIFPMKLLGSQIPNPNFQTLILYEHNDVLPYKRLAMICYFPKSDNTITMSSRQYATWQGNR